MKPFVQKIPLHIDDRGSVHCVLDDIGTGSFLRDGTEHLNIKRTYVVNNWSVGTIRAWHGHQKAWTGMHVIHGAAKLIARPMKDGWYDDFSEVEERIVTLSDRNPGILWVPPHYWNGSVSLIDNTKILVYSTLTFKDVKIDDHRSEVTGRDMLKYFTVENR